MRVDERQCFLGKLGVYFFVLLIAMVNARLLVAQENVQMKVLIFWQSNQCVDDELVDNILAETDNLDISFIKNKLPMSDFSSNEDMKLILARETAVAALWFTCVPAPCLHMVAASSDELERHRVLELSSGGVNVEVISAVVRSWLEAVDEAGHGRPRSSVENDNIKDSSMSSSEIISDDEEFIFDRNEKNSQDPSRSPENENFLIEMGATGSRIEAERSVPGGYVSVFFRASERSLILFGVAVLAPAHYREEGVELTLRKHPIYFGVDRILPLGRVNLFAGVAFESDVYKRTVQVEDYASRYRIMVQSSVLTTIGLELKIFRVVSLVARFGFRILLNEAIFEIKVGDENQRLVDPWLLQPVIYGGLRIGIF